MLAPGACRPLMVTGQLCPPTWIARDGSNSHLQGTHAFNLRKAGVIKKKKKGKLFTRLLDTAEAHGASVRAWARGRAGARCCWISHVWGQPRGGRVDEGTLGAGPLGWIPYASAIRFWNKSILKEKAFVRNRGDCIYIPRYVHFSSYYNLGVDTPHPVVGGFGAKLFIRLYPTGGNMFSKLPQSASQPAQFVLMMPLRTSSYKRLHCKWSLPSPKTNCHRPRALHLRWL